MFQVMYGDGWNIEKDDVEIIRRDLERGLKYGNRPALFPTSSPVITLPRLTLTGICVSTKAWSATFDDNGRITWYPQKTGLDELRG